MVRGQIIITRAAEISQTQPSPLYMSLSMNTCCSRSNYATLPTWSVSLPNTSIPNNRNTFFNTSFPTGFTQTGKYFYMNCFQSYHVQKVFYWVKYNILGLSITSKCKREICESNQQMQFWWLKY